MARKPKSPELRKTRTVNVSMTESQYQALFEEAKKQGVSVGKYVRELIDSRRVVINHEIVLDASQVLPVLRELSRIGNNLNQVAHLCNTIKRVDDDLELRLRKLNINLLAIIGACGPGGMTKKIIWTSASNQTGSVGNQRRAYPRVHLPDNHILRINGSTSYKKPCPGPPTLSTEALLATDASVTLMIGAKTIKVRIPFCEESSHWKMVPMRRFCFACNFRFEVVRRVRYVLHFKTLSSRRDPPNNKKPSF